MDNNDKIFKLLNIINKLNEFYCLEEINYNPKKDPNDFNEINSDKNILVVYFINGKEKQKLEKIDSLKKIYFFIKIYLNDNFINFLINRNNYINCNDLLFKINNMNCLRGGIKFNLKINEFPLKNYILIEQNNNIWNNNIYDKIFALQNSNEINNNLNKNLNDKNFRIEDLEKLLKEEKNKNAKLNNKINELEIYLKEKNSKIVELNNKIKYLEEIIKNKTNELNNKTILSNHKELYEIINKKNIEIENLKSKLARYPFELLPGEKMMSIIFCSINQEIHYSIICKNTDLFVNVELKLYEYYPNYRDDANYFTAHGERINKYKNLDENKIKNNEIILLNTI